jgi:hypothetical protein
MHKFPATEDPLDFLNNDGMGASSKGGDEKLDDLE